MAQLMAAPGDPLPPASTHYAGWYVRYPNGRVWWCDNSPLGWVQVAPAYYFVTTEAQMNAITDKLEGDLCYVTGTVHRLNFWDGSQWRQIRY